MQDCGEWLVTTHTALRQGIMHADLSTDAGREKFRQYVDAGEEVIRLALVRAHPGGARSMP